jgi:BASS family bile acid:Na+ symporter
MPVGTIVPWDLLTIAAAATVFTVMFVLGLRIVFGEFRWVWQHPSLVARALFAVLVAVPALAIVVTRAFDLPRSAAIGIVLMAIAPGAPVALRRSLDAGGHRSFAPALQIMLALLAVVSMPLSIAVLNEVYAGRASIEPWPLAKQVFTAQLLPLGIGMLVRQASPTTAARLEPKLARLATVLLVLLVLLVLIDIWRVVIDAGPRGVLAIVIVTVLALAVGHLLGGPDPATRTAVAISSAARNPGLALVVATLNHAPPEIIATVLAYLLVSAFTVVPYVAWRRRPARSTPPAEDTLAPGGEKR